ncbi:2-dehydropantoate 2-reductase [Aestuariirhabdus sp. Z084]|uniref:2-dehydropantoate 2-reductase n=1 Tax=Aestuariirhabdus haliotis TaxID=2918751 RepID=UPI00201B3973|nr:2-dehydropantoate 2-reductase [Aestuariirhabdus haliotis]MCL6417769.1 2-dehydropantoate 2-reductase [Aestuariirhabdus haliotis]MCL6421698.1 2-dehydropantoate 2-reductase [Aestuariirhabdus haliotis]
MSTSSLLQPKIIILGAGSIGCYIGGCLQAAGASITLLGRPRLQQQLGEHGLLLTDWQGRNNQLSPDHIDFSVSETVLQDADFILVTVKSGDTATAARSIASYAKANAVIVSLQNGIRNAATLQQYLPGHRIIKTVVPFNVVDQGKGHFHCGTEGNLAIEQQGPEAPLIEALEKARLPVNRHTDISGVQWSKLIMNLNNAVNALAGIPVREQLYNALYRQAMAACIQEALSILKAANIKPTRAGKVIPALLPYILRLPTGVFKRIASSMLSIDPSARSSMNQDLQLGRKTEIDYLNGEIIQLAHSLNLNAPINSLIVDLVKQAESNNEGSPHMTAEALFARIRAVKPG